MVWEKMGWENIGRKTKEEGERRERDRDVKQAEEETAGGCVFHESQTHRGGRERQHDHHRGGDVKEKTYKQTRTPTTKRKRRGKPGDRG